MKVIAEKHQKPIKMWADHVPVEVQALEQLNQTAQMPFIYRHLAVMPDVHLGMGATIGSVIPTQKAIIPAAVGVDIGCGMAAVKLNISANDLPDNLKGLRIALEAAIPHGRSNNGGPGDKGAWQESYAPAATAWSKLKERYEEIEAKHPKIRGKSQNHLSHLGTLGGGNHFLEICLDESNQVWVMLHSGSRGVGNRIGRYFIELAKKDMERWLINLPNQDLAYFPVGSDNFKDYWFALNWAQDFALSNRKVMMLSALEVIKKVIKHTQVGVVGEAVNCHHNYAAWENHFGQNVMVTRKGAVRAREGDLGIIPGSMGERSFIVRGKGNRESFQSCSHGAGRVMSRAKARQVFTVEDHANDTKRVECRKDSDVLDETPKAYKDIDAVMKSQEELVDIIHTLKQVVCVKG